MKVEIFGEAPTPVDQTLRLKLFPSGLYEPAAVDLCLVDEKGHKLSGGHLVAVTADGYLKRHIHIRPDLGVKVALDGSGLMEIEE